MLCFNICTYTHRPDRPFYELKNVFDKKLGFISRPVFTHAWKLTYKQPLPAPWLIPPPLYFPLPPVAARPPIAHGGLLYALVFGFLSLSSLSRFASVARKLWMLSWRAGHKMSSDCRASRVGSSSNLVIKLLSSASQQFSTVRLWTQQTEVVISEPRLKTDPKTQASFVFFFHKSFAGIPRNFCNFDWRSGLPTFLV